MTQIAALASSSSLGHEGEASSLEEEMAEQHLRAWLEQQQLGTKGESDGKTRNMIIPEQACLNLRIIEVCNFVLYRIYTA